MIDYVCILINENLSRRSFDTYLQSNIFSIEISKCYIKAIHEANHGSMNPDHNGNVSKIRTLPRANDPNWKIHSVYRFHYKSHARLATNIILHSSVVPSIIPVVKKELKAVEMIRYNNNILTSEKLNKLNSVRVMPGLTMDDLDLFAPDWFCDNGIEYQRIMNF